MLKAVQDNPGDVALVRLQFLILAAARDFKPAIATGEEMVQLDTAMADVSFFTRMTALYIADSQRVQAAEAARRGTVKFPASAELWQLYAQTLRTSGKMRESVAAARQALTINPNIPNGWIQVTQAYNELQEPDSAIAALRMAAAAGDNADFIASLASGIGNQKRLKGVADSSVVILQESVALLQWSDSVAMLRDSVGPAERRRARAQASPETRARVKFILGAAGVTLGQMAATQAVAPKSCELARVALSEKPSAYPPGTTSASPRESVSPVTASRTRKPVTRSSRSEKSSVKYFDICCTITTASPSSASNCERRYSTSGGPPVDAPITTTPLGNSPALFTRTG